MPQFRVMHSYETHGRMVDECVTTYSCHSDAYAHALRLIDKRYVGVWIQER